MKQFILYSYANFMVFDYREHKFTHRLFGKLALPFIKVLARD